jgi:predicted nucleotidyltransferase
MDETTLSRLRDAAARAFDEQPVLFAYLFGSAATGQNRPGSDVDVAVYVEDAVAHDRYFDLRLVLPGRLASAARVGEVDVLVLNESPLPVRGRAVRDGIVIYSRDEPTRVRYEGRTLKEFFDYEIHGRPLDEQFLRDTAEGRR